MKNIFLSISIFLFISGCVKEKIDLDNINSDSFDPSFAIPIGNVKLQLGRINDRADRVLEVNATTGLLELVYLNSIFESQFLDFYQLPNPILSGNSSMNAAEVAVFNSTPLGSSYNINTSNPSMISVTNSEQMDSLLIQTGSLSLTFNSTYSHSVNLTVTIPSLRKNGVIYSANVPLIYSGSTPVSNTASLNLDGYTLDLTDAGTTSNTVRVNINAVFTKGAGAANTSESIGYTANFNLSQVSAAFGYLGNRTISYQDSVNIDLNNNFLGGAVSFADPRLELEIINSTGIPFQCQFNSIVAIGNVSNPNISGPGLTSIPFINKAFQLGDSTITNHLIDNSNTSPTLTTIFGERLTALNYNASIQMNPNGATSNFVANVSKIAINSKIAIPLNGWGNGFKINDTTSTNLQDVIGIDTSDAKNLKQITLRISTTNGLPLESEMQIYFLNNNNVLLDSLFVSGSKQILAAPTINFSGSPSSSNYGKVLTPKKSTVDVVLTKDQYLNLIRFGQEKLVYSIKINTINSSVPNNVKIFPEDFVSLKVSAKVDLQVAIN